MSYEIYERDVIRVSTPVVTLNNRGRLVFNVAATKALHDAGVETVFLMWDKDARKFAVRATNKKDKRAYTISYSQGNKWAAISAKSFLKHIGHDMTMTIPYEATWNKDDLLLEVSTDKPQRQTVTAQELLGTINRQDSPAAHPTTNGNGHMTRKESVVKFLRENGPATRGEIMASLHIPIGTAGYVLNDPKIFVSREGRWHLVA